MRVWIALLLLVALATVVEAQNSPFNAPFGGGGTPGNPTASVQYNNGGSLAGDVLFLFDDLNDILSVPEVATAGLSVTSNVGSNGILLDSNDVGDVDIVPTGTQQFVWLSDRGRLRSDSTEHEMIYGPFHSTDCDTAGVSAIFHPARSHVVRGDPVLEWLTVIPTLNWSGQWDQSDGEMVLELWYYSPDYDGSEQLITTWTVSAQAGTVRGVPQDDPNVDGTSTMLEYLGYLGYTVEGGQLSARIETYDGGTTPVGSVIRGIFALGWANKTCKDTSRIGLACASGADDCGGGLCSTDSSGTSEWPFSFSSLAALTTSVCLGTGQ